MHWLELRRNFICGNETGSPGRAVSLHLARSGSQSENRIRRILPARGACHVINKNIDNSVNDSNINDMSSRRKDKSAIGVIDHATSDVMQPSCDGINGNDTASSDTISVTGVEKDPVNISSVKKNVDNSVNDSSDNKVSMKIMDFGLVPPSNVSHVTYSLKGIVGCGIGASQVVSGEVVVAGVSQSLSPPPACSEAEIIDALAIRKHSRLSGSSDADSLVFALSL